MQPPDAAVARAAAATVTLAGLAGRIPAGWDARLGRYRGLLAGRRMLIVLDDAATVDQVRPLRPGTGGCHVLITSRHQLPGLVVVDGARVCTLEPLPGTPDPPDLHAASVTAGRPS
jgi:hypothetical protein